MEKAVLKTIIYADIFEYPLKFNEIHKWLIGRKVTLRQLEKAIKSLGSRVKSQGGYYFLRRRENLVSKRLRKEKQSQNYFKKAKLLSQILKIIPWIKLVGISGALAMNNAGKKDDIDLVFITAKNRLWISRLLVLGLLSAVGQRRKRADQGRKAAGKLCCNIWLQEDKLEQQNKDLFTAHEVLQMKVLWQRDGIYSKYLGDNSWAFRFLPNWIGNVSSPRRRGSNKQVELFNWIPAFAGMTLENFTKWLQLKIMKQPNGLERITDGALYFHPKDCREEVLKKYKTRLQNWYIKHHLAPPKTFANYSD